MGESRTLRVISGQFLIENPEAILTIPNGKAQLCAHALDPQPKVSGENKAELGEYRIVARKGVGRAAVGFRKGEVFGLAGCELPRGLRPQVEILEGPPWDAAPAALAEAPAKESEPSDEELERLTAPDPEPPVVEAPAHSAPVSPPAKHSIGRKK